MVRQAAGHPRAARPTFVPVRIVAPRAAADDDRDAVPAREALAIRLRGDREVRIRGRVDLRWLGHVVRTLEGLGC